MANSVGKHGVLREAMETWWAMVRALRSSTDGMRAAGVEYLPMDWMERQNPANDPKKPSYAERLKRTFLFEAYDDSVARIASRPFQRAVQVGELPAPLDAIETNADLAGSSLTVFACRLLEDMADRGLAVYIVDQKAAADIEDVDEEGKPTTRRPTLADEDAQGIRPYFARITPDNLVAWQSDGEGAQEKITELRVRETGYRYEADYGETTLDRIRVWKSTTWELWEMPIATTSEDATIRQQVQNEQRLGHKRVVEPTPHRFPGDKIPLVAIYAGDRLGPLYTRPPLLRLAWLNVQHWQSGSQQSWILHYARAPLLAGKGMTKDEVERGITLGAGSMALSSSPDFGLSYVEPGGSSLEAGRLDLEAIERRMHALGMAPLTETNGPVTATGEVRSEQKQQSDTQKWCEALEWGLHQGYQLAAQWRGDTLPEDFAVAIWRDFNIIARSQQDLTTLESARARKDISQQTYLEEIQERGVLKRDRDIDEELKRVDDEGEALADATMRELAKVMPPAGENEGEQQAEQAEGAEDESDQRPPARRFPAT